MTQALTISLFNDFADRLGNMDEEVRQDALIELGSYAGTGTPCNEAETDDLGADYICALDTGDIVAWGAEYMIEPGVVGRELILMTA